MRDYRQDDPLITGDWAEIKQNLDPSFSYLVFETNAGQGKTADFNEILFIISPFKKMIRRHIHYLDKTGQRSLLVIQLQRGYKNRILREIMNLKLPEDVTFYIYGRRPRYHGM